MLGSDHWSGKNVLITGGLGFIGSRLAERLHDLDANVMVVSNYLPGEIGFGWTVLNGDVRNYQNMCSLISLYEIDIVYHFAANSIVKLSARDPLSTYDVNVMGTVNVLEAVRNVGEETVKRVVVASSDKAYGDHDILPYDETFALQPKNTYDTSKACMDMIARTYANNYGMPVTVTRCSNVYGPGDSNDTRIIPNTILRILSGKPPLLYSDIEDMSREFIFIDDVVDAYVELGSFDVDLNGEAFNIGGTGAISIRELVDRISILMGKKKEPIIIQRSPTFKEISKQCIDASKLMDYVDWKPRTHINDGLLETIEWYSTV